MILVFKTSVDDPDKLEQLQPAMEAHGFGKNWNLDLEDCDNILRLEVNRDYSKLIKSILSDQGFDCEPLEH